MTAIERGFFVYPWTLDEGSADETVRRYRDEYGVNSLSVNASYHSGRFYQPNSETRILTRHGSGLSFRPDLSLYPAELQPAMDEGAATERHLRIREACDKHGVAYQSWVVGLHNSTLGRRNPEFTVKSAFGTSYDYALCPSQPIVRRYLSGLVRDVAGALEPASISLETPGFLGFVHGHHHELVLSRLGPVGEYLLSLCFCPACKARAAAEGIDAEALQASVRGKIAYLTDRERGSLSSDFTHGELASLLVEEPSLHAYTMMRIRSVTELVRELHGITSAGGIKLIAVPSVFTRPGSKAWMEGTGLKALDEFVDGFLLLSYFPDAGQVKADIEWLRMFSRRAALYSAFNAGAPDAPDAGTLAACAREGLIAGAAGIYFYNASLLSNTRLEWAGRIMLSMNE